MNKVFFGKANVDRVFQNKSYRNKEKNWFNGIDVGDYIFIKRQGQTTKIGSKNFAVVNYLWKATSWGVTADGEHELFFDEIANFNNQLPLGKFVALDMFYLDKQLLNSTYKTVPGCIFPLTIEPGSEKHLVSEAAWNAYYSGAHIRKICILDDPAAIDPNSKDVQLVIQNNIAALHPATFITPTMQNDFLPDALTNPAPNTGSQKKIMYNCCNQGKQTLDWEKSGLVGFYDLFFSGIRNNKSTGVRKDFIDYCKNNGVPKAAKHYESNLRTLEGALGVNADDEYKKDSCNDMLSQVPGSSKIDEGDARAIVRKFIEYKKSLPGAVTAAVPASPAVTPVYKHPYAQKLLRSGNIIFRGAPGTGKSYIAKALAADLVSGGTAKAYADLTPEQETRIGFVQFHPSYDYSDFVEGLRPEVDGSNNIVFKRQDGIFMSFVKAAKAAPDQNFVFIIDEINRGEMSKILGELFFSIDPGYRGKDGGVLTQYSNMHEDHTEKFYIPENVYIIGTMNDIDRSVDTFDFAMRRRFRFIEIKANEHTEMLDKLPRAEEAIRRMKKLNDAISQVEELGENYHIGAAYFKKLENLEGSDPFAELWEDYLEPLLQEYVNGMHTAKENMQLFKDAYESGHDNGDESETN